MGLLLKAAGILLALTVSAAAQDYPSKPVRIVVPFPPGALNDTVGRVIAAELLSGSASNSSSTTVGARAV